MIAKDYIVLKIDSRMINGRAAQKTLRPSSRGGIPWMAILDGEGRTLITSDGPKGNVGCPVTESECAWFMEMLAKTPAKELGAEGLAARRRDLAALRQHLELHAKRYRR